MDNNLLFTQDIPGWLWIATIAIAGLLYVMIKPKKKRLVDYHKKFLLLQVNI